MTVIKIFFVSNQLQLSSLFHIMACYILMFGLSFMSMSLFLFLHFFVCSYILLSIYLEKKTYILQNLITTLFLNIKCLHQTITTNAYAWSAILNFCLHYQSGIWYYFSVHFYIVCIKRLHIKIISVKNLGVPAWRNKLYFFSTFFQTKTKNYPLQNL